MPVPLSSLSPSEFLVRDLELCQSADFENRDCLLPRLYRWRPSAEHPIHPQRRRADARLRAQGYNPGHTYVMFFDGTEDGKKNEMEIGANMKLPRGGLHGCIEQGWHVLEFGECLMGRDIHGTGDPMDDVLHGVLCPPPVDETSREALVKAFQQFVGGREDRKDGITAFERTSHARRVTEDDRCYGMGHTYQRSRKVEAPAAAWKVQDGVLTPTQEDMKAFVKPSTYHAISSWNMYGPPQFCEWQRKLAELTNSPRIGCKENYAWPSLQLNLAGMQSSTSDGCLSGDMQTFGCGHIDGHDSPTGISSLTVYSDLPCEHGEDPGVFGLLTKGVVVPLARLAVFFFSGLLWHCGSAPRSAPGSEPPEWAIRVVLIGYPAGAIVEGDARHALAALPSKDSKRTEPLYISPEMTGLYPDTADHVFVSNHANYAADGVVTMELQPHLDFMARSLLQLGFAIFRQLPAEYRIHIDQATFMRAFSARQGDTVVRPVGWELGPDGAVHPDPSVVSLRDQARDEYFHKFYPHVAKSLPPVPSIHPKLVNINSRPRGSTVNKPSVNSNGHSTNASSDRKPRRFRMTAMDVTAVHTAAVHSASLQGGIPCDPDWDQHATAITGSHDVAFVCGETSAVAAGGSGPPYPSSSCHTDNDSAHIDSEASGYESEHVDPTYVDADGSSIGGALDTAVRYSARLRSGQAGKRSLLEPAVPCGSASEHRPATRSSAKRPAPAAYKAAAKQPRPKGDCGRHPRKRARRSANGEGMDEAAQVPDVDTRLSDDDDPQDIYASHEYTSSMSEPEDSDDDAHGELLSPTRYENTYLSTLSIYRLRPHMDQVKRVLDSIDALPINALQQAMEVLNRIDLAHTPDKNLLGTSAEEVFSSMLHLRQHSDLSQITSHMYRQRIMLCERHFRTYITRGLVDRCHRILTSTTAPVVESEDSSLFKLLVDVRRTLETRKPIKFSSDKYFPQYFSHPCVYQEKRLPPIHLLSTLNDRVVEKVVRILRAWFNIPCDVKMEARASLVGVLLEKLGPGSLLLPETWNLYSELPRWLSDNTESRGKTPYVFDRFAALLTSSPPAKTTTIECTTLHHIKEAYREVSVRINRRLTSLADPLRVCRRVKLRHPAVDPCYTVDKDLDTTAGPRPLPFERATAAAKVVQLLRSGRRAADPNVSVQDLTPAERLMRTDSDIYQPWREAGTSRSRINGRQGERLDKNMLATPGGLFSVLIYRNVLHHSKYLLATDIPDHARRTIFRDNNDFSSFIDTMAHYHPGESSEVFFCNRAPFSKQVIKERTVANSSCIWNIARRSDWLKYNLADYPVPFQRAFQMVHVPKGHNNHIPGCGALTAYLTVADLCSHGVVAMPSALEMARTLLTVNKGGLMGLEILGYIPVGSTGLAAVHKAVCEYYDDVAGMLTEVEQEDMSWNMIVAEHALCKVKRLRAHYDL